MSFTCPECGRTSYHPVDEVEGYCGSCHKYVQREAGRFFQEDNARRVARIQVQKLETAAQVCRAVGEHGVANEIYRVISQVSRGRLDSFPKMDGHPDG